MSHLSLPRQLCLSCRVVYGCPSGVQQITLTSLRQFPTIRCYGHILDCSQRAPVTTQQNGDCRKGYSTAGSSSGGGGGGSDARDRKKLADRFSWLLKEEKSTGVVEGLKTAYRSGLVSSQLEITSSEPFWGCFNFEMSTKKSSRKNSLFPSPRLDESTWSKYWSVNSPRSLFSFFQKFKSGVCLSFQDKAPSSREVFSVPSVPQPSPQRHWLWLAAHGAAHRAVLYRSGCRGKVEFLYCVVFMLAQFFQLFSLIYIKIT